jgi:hypothetical protein
MSRTTTLAKRMLLAGFIAGSILVSTALPQSPADGRTDQPAANAASSRSRANRLPKRAKNFYEFTWGVDSFSVKSVQSGEMIRFSWRVLDAQKARTLHEEKVEPFLIDERAGVKLTVPSDDRIGQLRQTGTPEAGKFYWMVFSNKGRHVKRGDRVSVAVGSFTVDGLMVE